MSAWRTDRRPMQLRRNPMKSLASEASSRGWIPRLATIAIGLVPGSALAQDETEDARLLDAKDRGHLAPSQPLGPGRLEPAVGGDWPVLAVAPGDPLDGQA